MRFAPLCLLLAATPALGQELLTNGSFETGDATGWTLSSSASNGSAAVTSRFANTGDGSWVVELQSKNIGNFASVRSDPFTVSRQTLQFLARYTAANPDIQEIRIYSNNTLVDTVAFDTLQLSTWTPHTASLSAYCGTDVEVEVYSAHSSNGADVRTLVDYFTQSGAACPEYTDVDGDGYCAGGVDNNGDGDCIDTNEASDTVFDCDDGDSQINPSIGEITADAIDQDCDGFDRCYLDTDNDGYGSPATTLATSCNNTGVAFQDGDCAPGNAAINPDADEICDDRDNDCNGSVDDGLPFQSYYLDDDGDGYGDSSNGVSTCDGAPANHVSDDTDCDDTRATVNPGRSEVLCDSRDNDCDAGTPDLVDNDGDGYDNCPATDCDDTNATVYVGAPELCDGIDNDCNGEDDAGGFDGSETDDDGDGQSECENDCDDSDPLNFDGNTEQCDGADNDCNGVADNGISFTDYWPDNDGDGFGDANATPVNTCDGPPVGHVSNNRDCDDSVGSVYPGATEIIADGIDQDCAAGDLCYVDSDGDSYGDSATVVSNDLDCRDAGEANNADDCDDTDDTILPGATEGVADGVDQDCDGLERCYQDLDEDDFGTATIVSSSDLTCTSAGFAVTDGDCDDARAGVYPGATETAANGRDQDCDGTELCYVDSDGDGYGSTNTTTNASLQCNAAGISNNANDCDDTSDLAYPGATETTADGIDQDCDGGDVCHRDSDRDGFGHPTATVNSANLSCSDPGESTDNTDCDDGAAGVYPGATEINDDQIDQDCSGADSVTCYIDADLDGFGSTAPQVNPDGVCGGGLAYTDTDCNDTNQNINPAAEETPADGVDQDCNGTDLIGCYTDVDLDGFGIDLVIPSLDGDCDDPGESGYRTDCDDIDPQVNPAAVDTCGDGIDSNCDGFGETADDEDGDGLDLGTEAAYGSDPCLADTDFDNVRDDIEVYNLNTDPADPDTDGDGVDDGLEVGPSAASPLDTDGDGVIDARDTDDDGDRVPTALEDVNGDGDLFNDDTDNNGVPNFRDEDDDGDLFLTSPDEDRNNDLDPTNDDWDFDTIPDYLDPDDDNDGVLTALEFGTGSDPLNEDSDGDGVLDGEEFGTGGNAEDSDGDSLPDIIDDDDDNDGIPTSVETNADADGDGIPNHLDLDSDNDQTPDAAEGAGDADGDSIPNFLDPVDSVDPDNDGIINVDELGLGTDPNLADSDGDGRDDGTEVGPDLDQPIDTDRDGVIDALDDDDDNDGIPTVQEDINGDGDYDNDDTDGDGLANWQDPDEFDGPRADPDGDGLSNELEDALGLDRHSDDSDGDGIDDSTELEYAADATNFDSDGDGFPDPADSDDDNDGIDTWTEGTADIDEDGIPNHLDDDSDGDNVLDEDEYDADFVDVDCDGIEDWLDGDDADGSCDTAMPVVDPGAGTPTATEEGCGCSQGSAVGWLPLFAVLAMSRRRRR